MHKRIRRVFTTVRERACVSYANIATIGGYCDIELTVVKATSPDDSPLPDKYVLELLKIFSISSSSYRSFILSLIRRFGRTKSWRVALKCLLLLHRLIRSLPNDSPFRNELLWARSSGLLCLYPCNFRDYSSSSYQDYTSFVRSYAHLLDEILDITHTPINEEAQLPEDEISPEKWPHEESSPQKSKDLSVKIDLLPKVQSLIDRSIDCKPTGTSLRNSLVQLVVKLIIRDSFAYYGTFRDEIVTVLENLIQLPSHSRVTAFSIYKKAATQADYLSEFHEWSKSVGHCELYEYPSIDQIPSIQVRALENFLTGMWHLGDESCSSNTSSLTSNDESPISNTGPDVAEAEREQIELEPLIKWEDDDGDRNDLGWEQLLEASVRENSKKIDDSRRYEWSSFGGRNGWEIEEYKMNDQYYSSSGFQTPNPFYQQQERIMYLTAYASCPTTPMRPLIDL